ncbi:YbhB/YbcL family Raf kinase inhibitor-like protein [Orbus mooreae]|uniref:YbhB/YbcL family Raf kinase inhibitor-like protein n=1 Tax=Orbus mooreae TaxID=3074107 RepID=UPI00370CFEB7
MHEFNGFGCHGENRSPMLAWQDIPAGTEYFAITVYDPDAPTGSGWWHWQIINIPKDVLQIAQDAGNSDQSQQPKGAIQIRNDYGIYGFGGACPPVGDGKHRYQFTVYALPNKLDISKDTSAAMVGFMLKANAIASSTIEALYGRNQ